MPIPPGPVSVTIRERAADDERRHLAELALPPEQPHRGRQRQAPAASSADAASDGSWARIARSRSRSSWPGSTPRFSTSVLAGVAVDGERVGLAAAQVERLHQQRARPLPPRVRGDERLQLGDQVGARAGGEVGLDPLLERGDPELLEPERLGAGERLVGEVAERRAADEPERLAQQLGSALGPVGLARAAARSCSKRATSTCSGSSRSA